MSTVVPSKPGQHNSAILRIARVVWAAAFLLLLTLVVASLVGGGLIQAVRGEWLVGQSQPVVPWSASGESFYIYLIGLRYAALAVFWVVALLIFWRRSDDWIASLVSWVLLLMPFSLVLGGEDAPWETVLTFLGMSLFLLLLYIFPDGRFVPRSPAGRIFLVAILLGSPFLALALIAIVGLNYAPDDQGYFAFLFSFAAATLCGIASQVYRFRSVASSTERQQTRWVLFGLSAQLIMIFWWLLLPVLSLDIIDEPIWALMTLQINVLVPLMIPVTFGMAILRDGLWNIDPVVNRLLVYAALTVIIVSLYVLLVGALGLLFQRRGDLLVALVATGAVAVIFQPLRDRLQKAANRLMYGERDDPIGMLTRLAKQLEITDDPKTILPTLVETVSVALKFPYVAIWLPEAPDEGAWRTAASIGQRPSRVESIPIRHKNQTTGRLDVAPRSPGEGLAEADRLLLTNIAHLVALTIRTLELNEQLKQSRRQLVTAREEERRRIRRDLHDGLGPVLAALTLQADTAVDLVYDDPDEASAVLVKMRAKARTAVTDIRDLVYGLRPPALDELGLTGAIRQYSASLEASNLVLTVEAPDPLPALPAAVEVAAYRIAQEAIGNVTRHAQATSCTVRLVLDGDLFLEIIDDGIGLPADRSLGIGLRSMKERAAELGGTCAIESPPDRGVRVLARLPFNGNRK